MIFNTKFSEIFFDFKSSNSVNIWARKLFFFFKQVRICQKMIGYVISELRQQKCV